MEENINDQSPEQQDPPQKIAVKDFVAKIKTKYPEYKDIDDEVLAQKMVAKYPQYKDSVDFEKKKEYVSTVSSFASPNGSNAFSNEQFAEMQSKPNANVYPDPNVGYNAALKSLPERTKKKEIVQNSNPLVPNFKEQLNEAENDLHTQLGAKVMLPNDAEKVKQEILAERQNPNVQYKLGETYLKKIGLPADADIPVFTQQKRVELGKSKDIIQNNIDILSNNYVDKGAMPKDVKDRLKGYEYQLQSIDEQTSTLDKFAHAVNSKKAVEKTPIPQTEEDIPTYLQSIGSKVNQLNNPESVQTHLDDNSSNPFGVASDIKDVRNFENELTGINTKQTDLLRQKNSNEITNEDYTSQNEQLNKVKSTLLDRHTGAKIRVYGQALGQIIDNERGYGGGAKSAWDNLFNSTPSKEEVNNAIKKLPGLSESEKKYFLDNPGEVQGTAILPDYILKAADGFDKMVNPVARLIGAQDNKVQELKQSAFEKKSAVNPDKQFEQPKTIVDTEKGDNYLRPIENPNAEKLNWGYGTGHGIAGAMATVTNFIIGNKGFGALAEASGLGATGTLIASNVATNTALIYDDAIQTAKSFTKDENEQKAYALITGTLGGLLFAKLDPEGLVKKAFTSPSAATIKNFISVVPKEGIKAMTPETVGNFVYNTAKNAISNNLGASTLLTADALKNIAVQAIFNPASVKDHNFIDEASKTFAHNAIMFGPLSLLHGRGVAKEEIANRQDIRVSAFEASNDFPKFERDIQAQVDLKNISKEDAAQKIDVVKQLAEIRNSKNLPKDLSLKKQADYAVNILNENRIKSNIEGVTDKAQIDKANEEIGALQEERSILLTPEITITQDANSPTPEVSESIQQNVVEPKEQGVEAKVQAGANGVEQGNAKAATPVLEENNPLKDVEGTDEALADMYNQEWKTNNNGDFVAPKNQKEISRIYDERFKGEGGNISRKISEAYHADKAAGKETELTKSVESLLGKEQSEPTKAEPITVEGESNSTQAQKEAPITTPKKAKFKKAVQIKDPVMKQALEMDATTPEMVVAQHFISGGTIGSEALQEIFGGDTINGRKKITGELRARISYLKKDGGSVDALAHSLWESMPEHLQDIYSTEDMKEAVINTVTNFTHGKQIAKDIVERYGNNEKEFYDNHYGPDHEIEELHNSLSEEQLHTLIADTTHAEDLRELNEMHDGINKLSEKDKIVADDDISNEFAKDIIKDEGLTIENLEDNRHLFNDSGFPFSNEDYENVKNLLNGEGRNNSEPGENEQQGVGDVGNKKASLPSEEGGLHKEGGADNREPGNAEPKEKVTSKVETEATVKVLRLSHEAAIRELKTSEDKLAKEQAKQTSLFGDAPQKEMFANNPIEAKEILDPLKKKVKITKEAFDNATQELENQKDRETPDIFKQDDPKSKSVDEIIDANAQALIDFITPKHMKGVHTAGGSAESIIKAAAEIIKAAYHAKENIREAIEKAIDHIRDKFKEEGLPINGQFIDKVRDTFIPQADKFENLTHLKKVIKMVDENLPDEQILMHLDRKGVPLYNALAILGDAKANQITPEQKVTLIKEATEKYNKNVEDKWLGEKSLTLVESRVKAKDQQNDIRKSSQDTKTLKDKIRAESDPIEKNKLINALEAAKDWRNIDKAIHINLDLKRNPDHYNEFYDKLNPKQKAIVDLANNLSTKQLEIAESIDKEYVDLGKLAIDNGLIKEAFDNYVARAWDFGKADATEAGNKFSTSTKHSLQRSLDTILQGQAEGMKLKIEGASNNLQILKVELGNVIENRKLIDQGFSLKVDTKEVDENGKPIMQSFFSTKPRTGYAKIENSFFKKWAYIGKSGEDAEVFGSSNTKVIDGSIFEKRDIYAPKDVATSLNNILGQSKLIGLPGIDKLTSFSRLVKQSILSLSAFHPIAFTRAHVLSGKMTELKAISPIKAYKNGLEQLHSLTPEVKELLQGVLTIGRQQDWVEGIAGRGDGKSNVFSKMVNDFHKSLFENYGAGLKIFDGVNLYRHELIKNSKLAKPLSRAEVANKVGRVMNDTYGGENWQSMRGSRLQNPSVRHGLSLALLAPDWTISNLRLVKNAFKGDAQKIYRNMWFRVITRGVASTVAMNALMTLMDDKDENGNALPYWDAFEGRYKKAWDAGHLRSLMVDMTPLYRAVGGSEEERAYFSIFGAYTDPIKLVENPMDFLQAKLSPVTFKIPLEIATGENWQHKTFTDIDELLGLDDKGKYTKTQIAHKKDEVSELTGKPYKKTVKGFNEGDDKGGKLKGDLVKYDYMPHGGVELAQIPSFTLSQVRGMMPTAVQSIMQGATGENDWAKTLFTAPGTGVLFGKEGAVDESKSTYNVVKGIINDIKE